VEVGIPKFEILAPPLQTGESHAVAAGCRCSTSSSNHPHKLRQAPAKMRPYDQLRLCWIVYAGCCMHYVIGYTELYSDTTRYCWISQNNTDAHYYSLTTTTIA